MVDQQDIYIVIPAKDEASRITSVLKRVRDAGYTHIIVVDDGSTDDTAVRSRSMGAQVLRHVINLGPGAATQTGLDYAIKAGAKMIVTLDADGQHYPEDIPPLVEAAEKFDSDLVIGSRFLNRENEIPLHRQWYNRVGNVITFLMTGIYVSDSQSGMKAIRAEAAKKLDIRLNGYAFCTEIIMLIKERGLTYTEVPIRVLYSRETLKKGQSFVNGLRMLAAFFGKRFMNF